MVESNGGKFAAPLGSNTDPVEEGQEFVAKTKPEVEAGVG
jgi:hypothetical protein